MLPAGNLEKKNLFTCLNEAPLVGEGGLHSAWPSTNLRVA
jgi:hypothetical protein